MKLSYFAIYFSDPRIRANVITAKDLQKDKYIGILRPPKSEPGEVFMFPSWLEHAVSQNLTDNPRISISCNFVLHDGDLAELCRK